MDDGGAWRRLCTKYEVRCTIAELARLARGRWRRLAAPGGRRSLPMYDVGCTMYDLDYSAPVAREFWGFLGETHQEMRMT